jgi:hypothetical protein
MSRLLRFALAAALTILLAAPAARAQIPNPATSSLDGDLMLGNARGLPVPPGLPFVRPTLSDGYQIVVRDIAGNPVGGALVTIDFAGTALRPHSTQSGGQFAGCAPCPGSGGTISVVADAAGRATFAPATMGVNAVAGPNVPIRANGVLLGVVRFRSLDLTSPGCGGPSTVNIVDLDYFRCRFLNLACNGSLGNTDPSCDFATEGPSAGVVDVGDLNLFRAEYLCSVGGPVPPPCSQTQCP